MSGSSVQVPIARPASYAPAWAEKAPGVRVSRTLDIADLLASRQLGLVSVTVAADPPLLADGFVISDKAVSFFLLDVPPALLRMRTRVLFDLTYSDGSADEIVVFQPISAPVAGGLLPVDTGTPPAGDGFFYLQTLPATTWTIVHGLNRYPQVTVVDTTGRELDADVTYVDTNQVVISGAVPFAGTAYLS